MTTTTNRTGAASTAPVPTPHATFTKLKEIAPMVTKTRLSPKAADRIGRVLSGLMLAVIAAPAISLAVVVIAAPTIGGVL